MPSKLVELKVELFESTKVNGVNDLFDAISLPSNKLSSVETHPANNKFNVTKLVKIR
jgi:hypothetical protein